MKMKRALCLTMAATLVLGLTACGGTQDNGQGTQSQGASESTQGGSDIGNADGGQVLKVAAVETAYGAQMWKDVCAAFEETHPGVTVELTCDKKLEDLITPEMKSGVYPDVIMRAVGSESALTETFVKDNNVEDLTGVLSMTVPGEDVTVGDKILPGFVDNTITNPYGDGKTYLMPMFYSPCGLFYNKGLFEEKGWTVPETWDEMWELGETAKAEGIALFTYPTAGYFDAFLYALLHESMGSENFAKAMRYEEGIWDTPEAQAVFDVIAKLATYTEKTTPANANDNDFRKNQQLILDNKALFMPNGTWIIGEMIEAPRADGFEWGFTALPALEEGGERASYTFFEQVWMPKGAENKDLGKEFIAFLYSDKAAEIFASGESPAIQPIAGMSDKLEGDNKLFYSIYDNGAVAVMDAFATTDPVEGITVRTTFLDPVNSLVTGDKTKEEWIEQIKSDSDALRGALK
ncbi:MAG: carbohydrate ABC transporter substrate-binding protein [Lachnospiraceae bacterium]|nr:carbohydrate ABC transporter substrate-binding protein [Lachnospiraceae bacterium]